MAGIPKEEINRIQSQANIIDVISNYISLEKKGNNYFGVCPFHGDKGPSLSVNETMKFWKCFGCNKSGTVFDFVREIEHVSFPEAVKIVADNNNSWGGNKKNNNPWSGNNSENNNNSWGGNNNESNNNNSWGGNNNESNNNNSWGGNNNESSNNNSWGNSNGNNEKNNNSWGIN